MSAGRHAEAVQLFRQVIDVESRADSATLSWWRLTMAQCALGVALARMDRERDASIDVNTACLALDRWGRADRNVLAWRRAPR